MEIDHTDQSKSYDTSSQKSTQDQAPDSGFFDPQATLTPITFDDGSSADPLSSIWTDESEYKAWVDHLVMIATEDLAAPYAAATLTEAAMIWRHVSRAQWTMFKQQMRHVKGFSWRDWESEVRATADAQRAQDWHVVCEQLTPSLSMLARDWTMTQDWIGSAIQVHAPERVLTTDIIQRLLGHFVAEGYGAEVETWLTQHSHLSVKVRRAVWQEIQRVGKAYRTQAKAEQQGLSIIRTTDAMPLAPTDDLPPTFAGMVIPTGYRVSRAGIAMITHDELNNPDEQPITSWPIVLLRHLVNTDTDQEYVELGWLSVVQHQTWKRRIVSTELISHAQQMVQLAAFGAPVNSNNAKLLITYLDAFRRVNATRYPQIRATAHLGWQHAHQGFVVGVNRYLDEFGQSGTIEFLGDSLGDQQKAEGFQAKGTFETWLNMLDDLRMYPTVLLVLLASFATPLLAIVDAPNFVVDLGGNTSIGKTTTLELAASIWGQPDLRNGPAAMFSWASTHVGIETLSQLLNGLPVILDDTKTVTGNPRKVTEILYGIVSGMGKLRGAKAGGSRTVGHWRTILLSSGEQSIASFTQEGGVKTRTIAITHRPFGQVPQPVLVQRLKQTVRQHYGLAGAAFVQWILRQRDQWPQWAQAYQNRLTDLGRMRQDGAARLMEYRALLEIAAELLDQAWITWNRSELWRPLIASPEWEALWTTFEKHAADPLNLTKALHQLGSWAQAHAEEFMGRRTDDEHPPLQWAGQWVLESTRGQRTELCIYKHVLEKLLTDWEYNPDSIIAGWYDRGWLRRDSDGGSHLLPRIVIVGGPEAGKRKRVFYVLSHTGMQVAFDDASDDKPDDDQIPDALSNDEDVTLDASSLESEPDNWDFPF